MNALLVDDDFFVVAALEKKIEWKSLSIESVFKAYNVAQAREILKEHSVQILICDIEMPQGSGLELLAWIREEQYCVQTIFLTNYADFNYAQKAIELQSFDYFLKPIEFDKLTLIIRKAVAKARQHETDERAIKEGYFWQRNQKKMVEHFWRKWITGKSSPSTSKAIAQTLAEENLTYQMTDSFLPILVNFFPYDGSLGKEDKDLFDFSLLNVMYEWFEDSSFVMESIIEYREFNWMAVLKWKQTPDSHMIEGLCKLFIQKANRFLKCDICCSIGVTRSLDGMHGVFRELLRMDEEMIKCRNHTYLLERYHHRETPYAPPDLALLEELLNRDDPDSFLAETTRYLRGLVEKEVWNASVLSLFRLDVVQLVYSYLKGKEIQAHKLYASKENDLLFLHSLQSIEDMEKYLRYLLETAMNYRHFAEQPKSVAEELKQYIREHYGEDLTRNSLAEIVYLNPDYLARIFKKEAGISLGAYIGQVRIHAAKHMLETTNLSVYAIACKVGYSNYSYFSKFFKQESGCTPIEFRKRNG